MELRHYLQFKDFTLEEYEYLFARTRWIKDKFKHYQPYQPLIDRTLALVFEKHSTRTRVSFEAGMNQLGGSVITLMTRDTQMGRGEPIEDFAHGRHRDDPHLRADDHREFRRPLARAGDQRPYQRIPPVPDFGRHLHLH